MRIGGIFEMKYMRCPVTGVIGSAKGPAIAALL
jgi:hypothetical protein